MNPYHGVSFRDAARWLHVHERTVRMWYSRYPSLKQQARSQDGQVDMLALSEWYDNERDQDQARRRGNAGVPAEPRQRRAG